MNETRLNTRRLCVGYGRTTLIRDIQLELRAGEIMTLIGPNGAGKSTILKSIIRQLPITGGAVYLDGRDMAELSGQDRARKLSVLMTARVRSELTTCFDVAAAGRYPYTGRLGILSPEDREKTARSLELVHAADLADRDFTQISDGQRQRRQKGQTADELCFHAGSSLEKGAPRSAWASRRSGKLFGWVISPRRWRTGRPGCGHTTWCPVRRRTAPGPAPPQGR